MSGIIKRLASMAVAAGAVAMSLVSCDEGSHDYYYLAVNQTNRPVYLSYRVANDYETYFDTLYPGQTDTLSYRGGVSGDDVWDIETSAEIYQLSAIEGSLFDSAYSDNLRKRSLWSPVADNGGIGVFTLNITPDMFPLKKQYYVYRILNNTGLEFSCSVSGYFGKTNVTIPNGTEFNSLMVAPYYTEKSRCVHDLYDSLSVTSKVSQMLLSNLSWNNGTDTIYSANFNPNRRSSWQFVPTVINSDSVGMYILHLTTKTLE